MKTQPAPVMPVPAMLGVFISAWQAGQMSWLFADFIGTMTFGISLLITLELSAEGIEH